MNGISSLAILVKALFYQLVETTHIASKSSASSWPCFALESQIHSSNLSQTKILVFLNGYHSLDVVNNA